MPVDLLLLLTQSGRLVDPCFPGSSPHNAGSFEPHDRQIHEHHDYRTACPGIRHAALTCPLPPGSSPFRALGLLERHIKPARIIRRRILVACSFPITDLEHYDTPTVCHNCIVAMVSFTSIALAITAAAGALAVPFDYLPREYSREP